MESKRSTEESTDRGVSPVIGVILMVAITVILAAVIAAFVLDIGPDGDSVAPNAQFDWSYDDDDDGEWTLSHEGGENVDIDGLVIQDGDGNELEEGSSEDWEFTGDGDMSTGETIEFDDDKDEDDDITVIWDRGGSSDILTEN